MSHKNLNTPFENLSALVSTTQVKRKSSSDDDNGSDLVWLMKTRTELKSLIMWTEHINDKELQRHLERTKAYVLQLDQYIKTRFN
jgi:hypothetical protein